MKTLKFAAAAFVLAAASPLTNVASATESYKPAFSTHTVTVVAPAPAQPRARSLVQPVGYCASWFRECRYRWGYGWRFRRCMAIRGCL
ncbi:MAG: hypothetical protein NW215_11535 [Hyphomicrobiales bacterium]|nr:hypothetical protein [Hyphomicrobiales bacterium]